MLHSSRNARRKFLKQAGLFAGASFLTLGFSNLQAANANPLKIGYLPITDHLLVIAKESGANIHAVKFASWADLSEALRAKSIDGAFILTPLALKLKAQGLDIKALFAAHRNGSALVVKKGFIKAGDIQALKGRKIAIPSRFSTHYLLLANLLKQGGITPEELQLIDMPPPEMPFALQSGSVDGFIVAEPFGFIAERAKFAEVFTLSKDIVPHHICCVFVAFAPLLKEREADFIKVTKDFVAAATFIEQNPKESAKQAQKLLGHKANIIEGILNQKERVVYHDLKLQEEDIAHAIKDMKDFKVENLSITYKDFVDSSFIDKILQS